LINELRGDHVGIVVFVENLEQVALFFIALVQLMKIYDLASKNDSYNLSWNKKSIISKFYK